MKIALDGFKPMVTKTMVMLLINLSNSMAKHLKILLAKDLVGKGVEDKLMGKTRFSRIIQTISK